jgi:alkylhydroperoxidase family enzyme
LSHVSSVELPADLRRIHENSLVSVGEAERIEVFGNHPALYRWYVDNFYGKLFAPGSPDSIVDMRWKELIRLKLSLTHGCFVCNKANIPSTILAGFTAAQVDNIVAPTAAHFDEQELAVLELGEQFVMGAAGGGLTPELYGRLANHFSDAQILELGLIATILTAWTRLMFVFDLVTREDSCDLVSS